MTEEHPNKKMEDRNGQQEEAVDKAAAKASEKPADSAQSGEAAPQKTGGKTEDAKKPAAESIDADKEAKRKAAAEARAARAAAKAAEEAAKPKEPSPNQPLLDRMVHILKERVHEEVIQEAYINERNGHLPCVVIPPEHWYQAAEELREHKEFSCNYLSNLSGVDQGTHLEVVYHLRSIPSGREYMVKVKTDRERPSIPSVTPVWPTANWNEREVYDLLGVDFPGHPDLRRIMMPDDWVGHPLRKDYEPLDPEV